MIPILADLKTVRKDGEHTRAQILAAASEVFAEGGFRAGTIAEIAERAGVNHAAINYHFGGKRELYRQVWIHARDACFRRYPIEPPAGTRLKPAEELREFIQSLTLRSFDPGPAGHLIRLMAHGMAHPQSYASDIRRETMRLHQERCDRIVEHILGGRVAEDSLRVCRLMILTPTVGMGMRMVHHAEMDDVRRIRAIGPEPLIEGMFRFAMAGLRDLKRRLRSQSEDDRSGGAAR